MNTINCVLEAKEVLSDLRESSEEFHKLIKSQISLNKLQNSQIFRNNILLILTEQVNTLFNNDKLIQMYYNFIHLLFPLSDEFDFKISLSDEKFKYFFYAGIFLVSKFESNDYFQCFQQKTIKDSMNQSYLQQTEIIILNKIKKIHHFSPDEIARIILRCIIEDNNTEKVNNVLNLFNAFIYYSLSDYQIYFKFDQFVLSLTCLYISINRTEDISLMINFKHFLQLIDFDMIEIEKCQKFIEKILNQDDDNIDFEGNLSTVAETISTISNSDRKSTTKKRLKKVKTPRSLRNKNSIKKPKNSKRFRKISC